VKYKESFHINGNNQLSTTMTTNSGEIIKSSMRVDITLNKRAMSMFHQYNHSFYFFQKYKKMKMKCCEIRLSGRDLQSGLGIGTETKTFPSWSRSVFLKNYTIHFHIYYFGIIKICKSAIFIYYSYKSLYGLRVCLQELEVSNRIDF